MNNIKFAFRTLSKTPFVTLVAVVSLSLGVGANSAIFTLFNQILLRPLPVPEPEHLVNLSAPGPKPGSVSRNKAGRVEAVFSYPMFRDLQEVQTVLSGIAAHRFIDVNLAARGQTTHGKGMLVSGSYFPLLGIQPALGRLLTTEDDRVPGESPVAVLSHAYWETSFGRDPAMLNQTLIVNGQPLTIVGIAPRGFDGTTLGCKPQVFVPITLRSILEPWFADFENRRSYWVYLFGRLKPDVSLEQARVALDARYRAIINEVEAPLQAGVSDQTMEQFRAKPLVLVPEPRGQSTQFTDAEAPLTLLLGVTALVLMIACANVANLLLVSGAARKGEIAIRLSIGAGRRHLMAQLLTESCLLALFAGGVSLLVATWTLNLIAALLPADAVRWIQLDLDPGVLLYTAVLTLGTGLLFGLFPAIRGTRLDLTASLKGQAGRQAGARSASRFRWTLAAAQMALSLTLLVGAGLFIRSIFNVSRADLGLDADKVITFGVSPQLNGYASERSLQFFERLEDELAALPGVTGVSSAMVPLLAGDFWGNDVSVEGYPEEADTDRSSLFNAIGPGYFSTLGIPLMSGREFTRSDAASTAKVAIVNEAFAEKFNLGSDAVGKRIGNRSGELDTEIVGLAKNAKYSQVKEQVPPLVFRPYRQAGQVGSLTFYLRSSLEPNRLLSDIQPLVARLDPHLPVENLRSMPQQVRENVAVDYLIGLLSAAFACLATLLAAVGLYGVMSYNVAQRRHEIGVRMALGAAPRRVLSMVLRQVGLLTLIGGILGLGAAIPLGFLARSLFYQIEGYDPVVLCASSVALTVAALGAGLIPAVRASRVDPMLALRDE